MSHSDFRGLRTQVLTWFGLDSIFSHIDPTYTLFIVSGLTDKFNARHSCYICGFKDPVTEWWNKGKPRCLLSSMNDHSRFQESGGDPKHQMWFKNQIRDPINLTDNLRTPFYKYIRPDPLHHIKLGVMQDILSVLKVWLQQTWYLDREQQATQHQNK